MLITRRCSVLGGLLLLMAKGFDDKKNQFKLGLPDIPIISKAMYLQLAGRLMITFLFITQLIGMNYKSNLLLKLIAIVFCAAAFVMIGIGYKVRIVSPILCIGILIVNFFVYPWWEVPDPVSVWVILIYKFIVYINVFFICYYTKYNKYIYKHI